MDPVFEIITDQSSNNLLLFFYPIFPLFLFLFISHYFKKGVHGPHPWQGVHGPGPWKWFMDPVQSGGPWTPGP